MAAIRYLYNRLNQYQLSPINLEKENVILQINYKMAPKVGRFNSSLAINQFCQGKSITNVVVTGENRNVVSKASSVYVKLDGLQNDLSELIHILQVAERLSVKEIIQADIHLIPSKIESLEDLNKNQLLTNISWSRVAALKHNKSKYKKQKNSDPIYLTSNPYKFHSYSHQTVMSTLYMQLETFYFSHLEGSSLYDKHDNTAILMKNSVL